MNPAELSAYLKEYADHVEPAHARLVMREAVKMIEAQALEIDEAIHDAEQMRRGGEIFANEARDLADHLSALTAAIKEAREAAGPFVEVWTQRQRRPRADPLEISAHGWAAHEQAVENWKRGTQSYRVSGTDLRRLSRAMAALDLTKGETP